MPFTGPFEDRFAIRELCETNADGACRCDRVVWLDCYAAEARWKTHHFDVTGLAAIGANYDEITSGVIDLTFSVQILSIEVEGDTARCRAQQTESLMWPDGSTYDLVGRYRDELVRREGRWRFLSRDYQVKREKPPGTN